MAIDRAALMTDFARLRPAGGFNLIYADPPWEFSNFSDKGETKNPKAHYNCESIEDLMRMPVEILAARDCLCAMWATAPMLQEGMDLLKAWGFTYKTCGAWGKQSSTGRKIAFGTGYIFRSASEILLVGTRGAPRIQSRSIRNFWLAPVREHSRKPDQVRDDVAKLVAGPCIELFTRIRLPGWEAWGDQTDKFQPEEGEAVHG